MSDKSLGDAIAEAVTSPFADMAEIMKKMPMPRRGSFDEGHQHESHIERAWRELPPPELKRF